jgi:hypothetical protein
MPTEIKPPSAPTIGPGESQALLSGINSHEARPLNLTPLVIIAVLTLVLHVATGIVLDRSHASPAEVALDDAVTCPAGAKLPQPALPYD